MYAATKKVNFQYAKFRLSSAVGANDFEIGSGIFLWVIFAPMLSNALDPTCDNGTGAFFSLGLRGAKKENFLS